MWTTAMYNFESEGYPQELWVRRGEKLFVILAPPNKMWWKVQNSSGRSGFVPKTYLSECYHAEESSHIKALHIAVMKRRAGKISREELDHILAISIRGAKAAEGEETDELQKEISRQVLSDVSGISPQSPLCNDEATNSDHEGAIKSHHKSVPVPPQRYFTEEDILAVTRFGYMREAAVEALQSARGSIDEALRALVSAEEFEEWPTPPIPDR